MRRSLSSLRVRIALGVIVAGLVSFPFSYGQEKPWPPTRVSRAFPAGAKPAALAQPGDELGRDVHRYADRLHTVHFFCPEGGHYVVSPDGKSVLCSVHGSALNPRQPEAPVEKSAMGKSLSEFSGLTATLTFRDNGLHAVVVIERK